MGWELMWWWIEAVLLEIRVCAQIPICDQEKMAMVTNPWPPGRAGDLDL